MSNLSEEEIQNILDELNTVRPEVLNTEAKRLFEAIMQIADDRDKYKNALIKRIKYCNELEKDLFENCSNYVVSKDKIRKEIEEIKQILIKLDYHDIKDKNEREFYKTQYMQYVVARNILQGLLEDNVWK